jgi:hypothetical protein
MPKRRPSSLSRKRTADSLDCQQRSRQLQLQDWDSVPLVSDYRVQTLGIQSRTTKREHKCTRARRRTPKTDPRDLATIRRTTYRSEAQTAQPPTPSRLQGNARRGPRWTENAKTSTYTPPTRPHPERDQMLMSLILKAGGQRSPSNPRVRQPSTNELDPQSPRANKRTKASKATRTLDDGREFNDLPLLVERVDGKSDDESDNDVTDLRRSPTKSRTEKASETRN